MSVIAFGNSVKTKTACADAKKVLAQIDGELKKFEAQDWLAGAHGVSSSLKIGTYVS